MANVTYDGRSLFLDGKRIWLVSGAVHYFRTPSALWSDRLLKAKRAGLNCIETYVAWNFHEASEGKWDFTGDRDVAAFVKLAGEMGLYVILRPGPYICAEWDFGGLPAYLAAKQGVAYRTSNATYTHFFDKYFRQLLPRLADLQITREGKIILVQNENEYYMTTMPDRLQYLEFINQLLRRSGFEIPIINCNGLSNPPVPDNIECVNGWGNEVQLLKQLRLRQPGAPMLVTESWDGWFDNWGGPHNTRTPRDVARHLMEIIGCGAQYNCYMWHGGTNFGFWGSRLAGASDSYQTTSYDYDAPLAEAGQLTPKFYATRPVNLLANHMGQFIAPCVMEPAAANLDGPLVLSISGPAGRWVVVSNRGKADVKSVNIALVNGRELEVPLGEIGAAAVPMDLRLGESQVLDYTNLTPLGFFGSSILVLHGQAGQAARISVNGHEIQAVVGAGDDIVMLEHGGLKLVVINTGLAQRTWPLEDSLVFGPTFVGQTAQDVQTSKDAKDYAVLSFEGKLIRPKVKPAHGHAKTAPKLGHMKRIAVTQEPSDESVQWTAIDRPRDVDRLGVHYGYSWYRVAIEHDKPGKRALYLPECEDRAHLFLNGHFLGVWGRGANAVRTPISATFKRGTNVLVALVDNMGRFNFGSRLGELKGLYGHVHDAVPLKAAASKLKACEESFKRLVPRGLQHLLPVLEKLPMVEARYEVLLKKVMPLHCSFANIPHHVALLVNDRLVALFESGGQNFGDAMLSNELRKGKNSIRFILWGQVEPQCLNNVSFHLLAENLTQSAKWSYRPWQHLADPAAALAGVKQGKMSSIAIAAAAATAKAAKEAAIKALGASRLASAPAQAPAWFSAEFPYAGEGPLFVRIASDGKTPAKGQIYINGFNAGRFWTIGPQETYYLPEAYLAKDNTLMIFEEHGQAVHAKLELRP